MPETPYELVRRLSRLAHRRSGGAPLLRQAVAGRPALLAPAALEVALELGDPIGPVLADVLAEHGSAKLFAALADRCLESRFLDTLALSEVCRVVFARHATDLHSVWPEPNGEQLGHLAGMHHNLSTIEERLNHPDECLEHQWQAVRLLRRRVALDTAADNPARNEATLELATGIGGLGSRLDSFRRPREASRNLEEALDLLQTVTPSPEVTANRMVILHNLATVLGRQGQTARAIGYARESLKLLRHRAATESVSDLDQLVGGLDSLATLHAELDEWKMALSLSNEALEQAHLLALECPDPFRQSLATCLMNHGGWLHQAGQINEAFPFAEKAVAIWQDLANQRPDAFEAALASAFHQAGTLYQGASQWRQADQRFVAALLLWRHLYAEQPDRHWAALARTLSNHTLVLLEFHLLDDASSTSAEALMLLEQHCDRTSAVALSASILLNRSSALSAAGNLDEAVDHAEQAVTVLRAAECQHPGAFQRHLATALSDCAVYLGECGELVRGLSLAKEAAEQLRQLHQERPGRFVDQLAATLSYLGELEHRAGQASAVETLAQALTLRRALAASEKSAHRKSLAKDLLRMGRHCASHGHNERAYGAMVEAVGLLRDLAVESARNGTADLAAALGELAELAASRGNHKEARATIIEALALTARFAEAHPDAVPSALNDALGLLGDAFGLIDCDLADNARSINPQTFARISAGLDNAVDTLQSTSEPPQKLASVGEAAQLLLTARRHRLISRSTDDRTLLEHVVKTVEALRQAVGHKPTT